MSTPAAIDIGALQSGYGEAMVLKGIDLTLARGQQAPPARARGTASSSSTV